MFLFSLLLLFFFLLYSFINQNILVNKDYDLKDGEKVNEQEHDPDQDQEQDQEESQDQDQGHHEFETDSQQSNNDYEHYDELNQSFLKGEGGDELPINSSYMMSLDLRAHSPELSTEIIENHDSIEDENICRESDDLEKDLAEVTSQLNLNAEKFLKDSFDNNQILESNAQIYSGNSNRRE